MKQSDHLFLYVTKEILYSQLLDDPLLNKYTKKSLKRTLSCKNDCQITRKEESDALKSLNGSSPKPVSMS